MTVSTTSCKAAFTGNGVQTVFAYTFPIPSAGQHSLFLYTASTGALSAVSPSNYSVSGIGTTGGNVTYPLIGTPAAVGQTLYFYRTTPPLQTTKISNQGAFYPEVIMTAMDILCMEIQQIYEGLQRCLYLPVSDAAQGALPTAPLRANGLLGFDSSGVPTIYPTIPTVNAFGLTATGTTQGTALAVTAAVNCFSTVPANSGCILTPNANPDIAALGQVIANRGANTIKVYPPVGGQIENYGVNVSALVLASVGGSTRFIFESSTQVRVL